LAEASPFATVTAPLARWAARSGDAVALDDGERRLDFAALHRAVSVRAASIAAENGPAIRWVGDGARQINRLIEFCAIVETGRAAAVADPDWPAPLRHRVEAGLPRTGVAAAQQPSPDIDFYVGFTSGSTDLPKAFIRDHRSWTESFTLCLDAFGDNAALPIVAPGRLSHSYFLFAFLLGLWTGAGVHMQDRFSAPRCLDVLERLDASCLMVVPSQLLLLLDVAERRRRPIHGVRLVLISGARWMRRQTPRLRAIFPDARIIEFYGASETSFVAWTESGPDLPDTLVGRLFPGVELDIRDASGPDAPGLIFVRSPMLFGGYVLGDDGSLLRDGAWISVRDIGRLDGDGRLHLLGRQNRMIVTQGKNVFPEEVEAVLERHPGIAAASVLGVPDVLRGMRLAAIVQVAHGGSLDPEQLAGFCRQHLPAFKAPRHYVLREAWLRTAGGKTDHARLAAAFHTLSGDGAA
jgi:long-chain acyl-CoA synthetase